MVRKTPEDYLIIDCHTHLWTTPQIGSRAVTYVELDKYCGGHDGTVEDALAAMKQDHVSKTIMMNWIPTSLMRYAALERLPADTLSFAEAEKEIARTMIGRTQRRNAWTCAVAQEHPELVPFITVDVNMTPEEMRAEILDKVRDHGARGMKLHHAFNGLMANDRRLYPAYATMQELDLPIMCHSGVPPVAGCPHPPCLTEPKLFTDILTDFPRLRLVLAHVGEGYYDQARYLARKFPQLNFDCTAVTRPYPFANSLDNADFVKLVRDVGVERVVFGGEFPMFGGIRREALQNIIDMDFTEEEKRMLLGENALRVYKLA
ncbi:MAG: amidohydrolase [Chloroflexi bacterium]|nr:amidohydrolase [Chloroflexota bacterium]